MSISNQCHESLVHCPAKDLQCSWKGKRAERNTHEETCNFQQLRPILSQLIKVTTQQSTEIQQLSLQIEQQKTEAQKQINALRKDITLLIDQQSTETSSKLQNEYETFKKEVTQTIDKRCTDFNATISKISQDTQKQSNGIKQSNIENPPQSNETITTNQSTTEVKKTEHRIASAQLSNDAIWIQTTTNVAGVQGSGNALNRLSNPLGIDVDDQQTVYIADRNNHRIVQWQAGATTGQIIAGGKPPGIGYDQLNMPTDVKVDRETNSIYICDSRNRRILKGSLQNPSDMLPIIENVDCFRLAIDNKKTLYFSDIKSHQVKRYRSGKLEVVAGKSDAGDGLDQLDDPRFVCVDQHHSVYVTDLNNHRVMKWANGSKKGVVVAGGKDRGNGMKQLSYPQGLFVDGSGNIFVADHGNNRIMRWCNGVSSIVIGQTTQEEQTNSINLPTGLSIDQANNIYVANVKDHLIQRFSLQAKN
ncbi:hypothetical protein I4U23_012641 [Adineta vaga]|nr:hypothetical protein I4U23_012641 [Adineta vaga]